MADMIAGMQTLNTGITLASTMFEDIYSLVESVKAKRLTHDNLLRAYYLEVINNIEFLSVIDFSHFKNEKPNSTYLRSLLQNIDVQIGATILFESDIQKGSDLYVFLENKGKIQNKKNMLVKNSNGKEQNVKGKIFYENILQAISFTVVKTQILRRLVQLTEEELKILNKILLEKRILNIYERFMMIKVKMDELNAIKSIAR